MVRRASPASCAAYDAAPTRSSCARHVPETTKLPDRSVSPSRFSTGSASPVMSDSFTSACPHTTVPSAQISSPAENSATSPCTSLSVGSVTTSPSRTARAVRAERMEIFSSVCRTRSSCTIPMTVLHTTIKRNSISR